MEKGILYKPADTLSVEEIKQLQEAARTARLTLHRTRQMIETLLLDLEQLLSRTQTHVDPTLSETVNSVNLSRRSQQH